VTFPLHKMLLRGSSMLEHVLRVPLLSVAEQFAFYGYRQIDDR
jgi:hypothetical protein